ncbi:MAG: CoA transferase, partial [Burkholderiales bacterium]
VMKRLTEAISKLDRHELLRMLDEAEVPVGPVNDVAEILTDPHVRTRGLVGSFDYPQVGEFKALKLPFRFLGWDNPEVGAPPALGADTEKVLAERLGYSSEKIAQLRAAKAI